MSSTLSKSVKLGVFTLAIMNVTAVVSLRGLPAEAEYGISSAFYYLFAAIVFLIPTSFVAAELAAMFQDKQGGVFRWVGEAFGKRIGFLAIWLQWVESTIWYPTVLTFGAVSLAFIGSNSTKDMVLASNKIYTLAVVLIIYWAATFISQRTWMGEQGGENWRPCRYYNTSLFANDSCCCLSCYRWHIANGLRRQFLPRYNKAR